MSSSPGEPKRLCIECQEFLPLDKFKNGIRRSMCRIHYNIRHRDAQRKKIQDNPRRLQSSTVWQMAFIDAQKIFKTRLAISPSEVRELLSSCFIDPESGARLVPVDPLKPLSISNYCLTTSDTRREMCQAWKALQSPAIYGRFLSPELGRRVYARCGGEADVLKN